MNKNKLVTKMRYLLLLTVAFMAGCASNGEEIPLSALVTDTVAPTVSFTAPAANDLNVPLNQKVLVAFSEVMNQSTINQSTFKLTGPGLTLVSGAVASFGTSATFTPAAALAANTPYTATITTGVKDLAGNAMAATYGWTFTTGAAAVVDLTAPTVSVTSPTNTAIAVPINRLVTIGFSEAMDPATVTDVTFKLASGAGLTPVTGTVISTGTSAVFDPTFNLLNNTLYTATVTTGAKDLAGNAMVNNKVFTFTTGIIADTTAPLVISTIPLNLATGVASNSDVTATFSESMNPVSITTSTYLVKETVTGNNVPGAVTYTVGSRSAVFNPTALLTSGLNYTATIKSGVIGAQDLAGNPLAVDKVWTFTVGGVADTIAPTVILVNPLNLATDVAINSSVNATFSEAMDPATISTATFSVKAGVNPPVVGTVAYDVAGKIAIFTPVANLDLNTTYTATVTTGAKDLAGNSLAVNYVWSFTTANVIVPPPVTSHLGSAAAFGIMATLAITNTGPSMVNGDVSLNPGTSNGLTPAQVNGTIHINDAVSLQAKNDLLTAFNYYTNLAPGVTVPGGFNLGAFVNGGLPGVLPPGTYTSGSSMLVSTPVTLNGTATDVWVFQIGSSLTTTANVILGPGVNPNNVFWVPALDASVGVGSIFNGTIVAGRDATGKTNAVINGRILAGATNPGTIALDSNTVNVPAP